MSSMPENVYEIAEMRDRTAVFRDRRHAGKILAGLIGKAQATIMAVPAGGVPVAAVVAEILQCPLDLAVVSKITLPWNSEAGYGAVAFDGSVQLNRDLLERIGLGPDQVEEGILRTRNKVRRRLRNLRGDETISGLRDRAVIVVDDGLASGFTLRTAVAALGNAGARPISVAVPTGHASAVADIAGRVAAVYCCNLRGGWRFAVAAAYEKWYDVTEEEVAQILRAFRETS